jgi:2',3'-cyclic-nucleotide 2'-phosphodiesterase / 3'-nucleotidase
MKRALFISIIIVTGLFFLSFKGEKKIDLFATTDIHGMLLPYDFAEATPVDHSMANLAGLIDSVGHEKAVLLDNGDILQGDPLVYYSNFIDTLDINVVASMLNRLGYDAATVGNHDIETGHRVYDKARHEYRFPLLAANAIDEKTGKPYFIPYTIIKKNGLKIAVMGLITPSVPQWLPQSLYKGIRFDGMVETAKKWMPEIKKEKPDLIIGLFHSGMGTTGDVNVDENSSLAVAANVPGFDIIFLGHDHATANKKIVNSAGDTVLLIDGGSRSSFLMHASVRFISKGKKQVSGELIKMNTLPQSRQFTSFYDGISDSVKSFTSRIIGFSTAKADSRESFFGPSAFVDLIHDIQLSVTGARVSFAAPLSFSASIDSGQLRVSDMFRLYRYENFLYSVKMTGKEIDSFLEHSYSLWMNTMKDSSDCMLKYRKDDSGNLILINGTARLENAYYNFDSAKGLIYSVDLEKPDGDKVTIKGFSDGRQFSPDSTYSVAVNSYRANGGGGHFAAAGIDHASLQDRIIFATSRDMRYYIIDWIKEKGTIRPEPSAQWTVIPESWKEAAERRERPLLFGNKKKTN